MLLYTIGAGCCFNTLSQLPSREPYEFIVIMPISQMRKTEAQT